MKNGTQKEIFHCPALLGRGRRNDFLVIKKPRSEKIENDNNNE